MTYQPYCSPYYDYCYSRQNPCLWDYSYNDYCSQPALRSLKRYHSFDSSSLRSSSYRNTRRKDPVKIYLNIRYKHTSNCDTLLYDEVCVEISPNSRVMDVWRAAKKSNRYLRHFQPTEKVLTTDSDRCYFTHISSHARVRDEYHKNERHWVFVVYPPYNCRPAEKKPKKKETTRGKREKKSYEKSCSCGCC